MNDKARNLDCLYNVYLPTGMVRLTDREATRQFGPEIWDHYAEHVDHSEWCDQHAGEARSTWVTGEPIAQTDEPPF